MVYLLKMVIFHGYVSHNQMVSRYVSQTWATAQVIYLSQSLLVAFLLLYKTHCERMVFLMLTRPGKLLHNCGKSPLLMGKSTISMAIFNSYVTNYQRVIMQISSRMIWHMEIHTNTSRCWIQVEDRWDMMRPEQLNPLLFNG